MPTLQMRQLKRMSLNQNARVVHRPIRGRCKCSQCSTTRTHFVNFHPREVVSRYRDTQLQVAENL